MIKCSLCGEEYKESLFTCPGCGAKNTNAASASVSNGDGEVISAGVPGKHSKREVELKTPKLPEGTSKNISNKKIFYIVFTLIILGSFILILSGIFDSSVRTNSITNQNQEQDPHAGIDLSSLQQMKELEAKIDANPKDYNSIINLAHLLNDSGFKEKAIERYQQYLKANPNEPDVLVDMGVCYYELGKNEDAIAQMEKAIKLNPSHQIAHLNLGIVNYSSGNKDKAMDYWKKAAAINPTSDIAKRAQELINQH